MKIFVSGGAGFIGSHLCQNLLQNGHDVVAYDNLSLGRRELIAECLESPRFKFVRENLLDGPSLKENLRGVDLVYHLAANSDISLGNDRTDLDLKQGTLATYALLEAMRLSEVKNIIFASTSAIYGEAVTKPTPENYGPLVPISFYGASKMSAESLVCAFAHQFGMRAWIFRFANVVGGNLTHGAIFDFMKRLRADSTQLKVLGNGTQKKSYLHVSDCIAGMQFAFAKAPSDVNIFNLTSEGFTEVSWLAEQVVARVAPTAALVFGREDRGWKGDVPFTWLDAGKLARLGWNAKHSSNEAVAAAIDDVLKKAHLDAAQG